MHPDETAAPPPPAPDAAPDASSTAATPADAPQASAADEDDAVPKPSEPGLSPAECGARLAELFPALFVAPGAPGPFKPIKLRIHADILARAPGVFSKRVLGIFFSRYTTSNAYLRALTAPGAQRFDLDGQPAGEIAEEHRAAAVEELARRQAIAAQRRALQRRPQGSGAEPAGAANAVPAERLQRPEHERERPRRPDAERGHGRPPRHEGAPRQHGPHERNARPQRPMPQDRPRRDSAPAPRQAAASPSMARPLDPAQRERALLLRAFESSPLSKANFCVLKRISEAELDALLAQARTERG